MYKLLKDSCAENSTEVEEMVGLGCYGAQTQK
jgi:hypothetical protein